MNLSDHAKTIEVEALRRAVLRIDAFLVNDELTPAKKRDLRLMLARRYDKLITKYKMDTHELLVETVQAEYAP